MHLASLHLHQFRCFPALALAMPDEVTILHGRNAQGKTSVLEAVCVLLRLQSPRARAESLKDCVRLPERSFVLGGRLEGGETRELRFQYRESGRRLVVDGESQRSGGDYLRHSARVVWMANDDLALVRGGGEGRRRFLDFTAAQLFPGYREALRTYDKALRSRNYLLKRDQSPRWPEIDAYTRILHQQGEIVTARRRALVDLLSPRAASAQSRISGRDEALALRYLSASGEGDDLAATLLGMRDEESKRRQTVAGPHRDDLELELDGLSASKFASEGQQRTIALALKLGQALLFLEAREEAPILLIDDVFGELDPERRNALMAAWPAGSQKIITTTHLDWLDSRFGSACRLLVADGKVTPEG
jgi:DNA replication and repair protein RecF